MLVCNCMLNMATDSSDIKCNHTSIQHLTHWPCTHYI
jgi:hypothetical protein